jgi:hypothetical protein
VKTTTSTTTTTTSVTAATVTATTVPTVTSAPAVTILAPLVGAATIRYKGETLMVQIADAGSSGAVGCVVDWGDGKAGTFAASAVGAGSYRCAAVHTWVTTGFFTITVTATDERGVLGTSSAWIYVG